MSNVPAAIGIDVGGTKTKGAVVERDGELLARVARPTDTTAGTKGIIAVAEDLLRRAAELDVEVGAVGVGAAGFIDAAEGAVNFSPNLTYDDPHLKAALEARLELPVVVENDANAAVWAERAYGSASGLDDVALLTLGTGIGSGFIIDGRLLRGATGAGAEFGHTVVDPSGPECLCGLRGCIEQFASGTAIARMAKEWVVTESAGSIVAFAGTVDAITAEHVAKAARQYDEAARTILRQAGKMLGIGLSNVANLFDPEVIVLAGSVTAAGEAFLGPARDELARMTIAQRRRPMRLDVSVLEGNGGILGSAALAFDEVRR